MPERCSVGASDIHATCMHAPVYTSSEYRRRSLFGKKMRDMGYPPFRLYIHTPSIISPSFHPQSTISRVPKYPTT